MNKEILLCAISFLVFLTKLTPCATDYGKHSRLANVVLK